MINNQEEAQQHYAWLLPIQVYCITGGVRFTFVMSIFSLAALTLDRVLAVIRPFYHRNMKKKYAFIVCALTWIISLVLTSLNIFLHDELTVLEHLHIAEVAHNGRNDTVAIKYFEISLKMYHFETKLLHNETVFV